MSIRTERVARLVQREVADILNSEYGDQVQPLVTVTNVRVTADLGIASAPLLVNTPLAVGAFAAATVAPSPVAPVGWWVGATLAFTAFPSHVDTETLLRTAGDLPRPVRPVGYGLAVPLRAATAVAWLPGVYGVLWVWVCLGVALPAGAG